MIPLRDNIPPRRPAVMVRALLVANLVGIVLQIVRGDAFTKRFAVVPEHIHAWWHALADPSLPAHTFDALLPLLTSQFLHGSALHIASNLLFLWIFADNVEGEWSPLRFLFFYLFCGVVACLTHVLLVDIGPDPTYLIGASGAIAGTLGAYFVMFPHARVLTLIPIGFFPLLVEIPAAIFLLLWFGMQLMLGVANAGGNVAVWAHAGGFVAGVAIAMVAGRASRGRGPGPRYPTLPPRNRARTVRFERHSR